MAQENVYPVYLIAGFLDSGKTSFINGILSDGFAMEDRTMLLCCEEGEEAYDKKLLRNVTVVTADSLEALTGAAGERAEEVPRRADHRGVQRHVADPGFLRQRHAPQLGALPDHCHGGGPNL